MEDPRLFYKAGYKYQLTREYYFKTHIQVDVVVETDWIRLDTDGQMTVKKGYAWNGASMVPDTQASIFASCGHDATGQLMQLGLISWSWLPISNYEYYKHCLAGGMCELFAMAEYDGLKLFSEVYMKGEDPDIVLEAP